ncbi:MAG: hypothetical protein ACREPF_12375 [Rhodanobacteraceae bacterium]
MNSWIDPAQSLPAEREHVRFFVVGHHKSLTGVYEDRSFRSRWGSYDQSSIEVWRKLGNAPRSLRPSCTGSGRDGTELAPRDTPVAPVADPPGRAL